MNAKTILVPVDFSDVTPQVTEVASSIAAAFRGRLILLHVEEPEPAFVGFEPGTLPMPPQVVRDTRLREKQLEDLRERLSASGLEVTAFHLQGAMAERICEQANTHGADLIVMGSHGHGALYNLLIGSVTSGVLKEARCPVLVVPARKHR
jgi:nucleotide-binding universal stress UspA family protein